MAVAEVRFSGRYRGQSGHDVLRRICLLLTQSGHGPDPEPWCLLIVIGLF